MTLDKLIDAIKKTALAHSFVSSNSEFRRLVEQGGVKLSVDTAANCCTVKLGKRRWFKLLFN